MPQYRVFMNIQINAIDALEEIGYNEKESKAAIAIRTAVGNSENIVIKIADNGPGMAASVKQKIFPCLPPKRSGWEQAWDCPLAIIL